MESNNKNLSAQNKLILVGLIVSTLLIMALAIFAVSDIEQKLELSYSKFGQMITKTLAIESVELISKPKNLEAEAQNIISGNDELAFIEFFDANNSLIYSSRLKDDGKTQESIMNISAPVIKVENGSSIQVGSVTIGLAGKSIKAIKKTAKNSMLTIFTLAWLVFTVVALINTFLITREIRILQFAVRKISKGEFGYQVDGKSTSGEVKELIRAFNDMSARLHVYEEQNIDELTLERNKLEAVLMNIANGVVVCDRYDNIVLINSTAQKMLESDEKLVLNSRIQEYCDLEGKFCFKSKIEEFKDTPLEEIEQKPLESHIIVDNKTFKSIISPMFSKNADYTGYTIVLIDITKEVEVDKLKNNFISNVSHELRTPVTILQSYIDTLHNHSDEFDEKTKQEFIQILDTEANRLHSLVNDVLDFSRLEDTAVKLDKAECSITKLIEKTINSMSIIAQEKNITFSVMQEADLPSVMLNQDSIERVLQNLISNAIKYSPNNSKVKVKTELAEDLEYIEVSIQDYGIGISAEYQEKIFDRFFRVENDTHTIKGTGLGLHLVKVAVENQHQGKLSVKSAPNEGSTFTFRLPIHPLDARNILPEAGDYSKVNSEK